MYVLPVSEKKIKHWKSIQIPVPLSQVTANFKILACPYPPNRILKDSPPTASPLEFLRKGKRVKERWTRGLSQLKCQPSSGLFITAHLRSKNPSADRISLKKCRVEPVVKTASLVSTTSAGLRHLRLGATHSVRFRPSAQWPVPRSKLLDKPGNARASKLPFPDTEEMIQKTRKKVLARCPVHIMSVACQEFHVNSHKKTCQEDGDGFIPIFSPRPGLNPGCLERHRQSWHHDVHLVLSLCLQKHN